MNIILPVRKSEEERGRDLTCRNKSAVDFQQLELSWERGNSSSWVESLRHRVSPETSNLGTREFVWAVGKFGLRSTGLAGSRSLDCNLCTTVH